MEGLPRRVDTKRLTLRSWRPEDLEPLVAIFAEKQVWQYPLRRGRTRDETASFLERQLAAWERQALRVWAAELRATDELIGYIGLTVPEFLPEILPAVEVGWRIHPRHWGQGLATEGGHASLRVGFGQLDLERIVSIAEPDNPASTAVMERLGMVESHRTVHPKRNVPLTVYEMTSHQWHETVEPAR